MIKLNIFTLLSLAILGITLSSCNNSKKTSEDNDFEGDLFSLHPADYQADFVAYAADSSWKITLVFDQVVMFTDKENKIQFRNTSPKHQRAQDADIIMLEASNDEENFELTIDVSKCEKEKTNKISFVYSNGDKKLEDEGCGKYTGNIKLLGIWSLIKLNGEKLERSLFTKQPPFMEFNLKKSSVSGFGGCNDFSGNLDFSLNQLKMGPLVATKKYCGDNSDIENELFELLNNDVVNYRIEEKRLILETTENSAEFISFD